MGYSSFFSGFFFFGLIFMFEHNFCVQVNLINLLLPFRVHGQRKRFDCQMGNDEESINKNC